MPTRLPASHVYIAAVVRLGLPPPPNLCAVLGCRLECDLQCPFFRLCGACAPQEVSYILGHKSQRGVVQGALVLLMANCRESGGLLLHRVTMRTTDGRSGAARLVCHQVHLLLPAIANLTWLCALLSTGHSDLLRLPCNCAAASPVREYPAGDCETAIRASGFVPALVC